MPELLALFGTAFLAGSLVPLPSEGALIAVVLSGQSAWLAVVSATLGNTLGAVTSYVLGRLGHKAAAADTRRQQRLERARAAFERWGAWCLLLTWVPIVGDPLTFAAGLLKVRWWLFLPLTLTGKLLRYILVVLPFV